MDWTYWRLHRNPFGEDGAAEPFDAPSNLEALARMDYVARGGGRVGLLLGPCGVGKSTLLRHFARHLERRGDRTVRAGLVGMRAEELLSRLVERLAGREPRGTSPVALWQELADSLAALQYQRQTAHFLLDDVDQAGPDVGPMLCRLAQRAAAGRSLILSADPGRLGSLTTELGELVHLRIDLPPWDRWQTIRFLRQSLARAGAEEPIFDRPALDQLFEHTGGRVRHVVQLAELALVAAAGRRLGQVDRETVEAAAEQLTFSPRRTGRLAGQLVG